MVVPLSLRFHFWISFGAGTRRHICSACGPPRAAVWYRMFQPDLQNVGGWHAIYVYCRTEDTGASSRYSHVDVH